MRIYKSESYFLVNLIKNKQALANSIDFIFNAAFHHTEHCFSYDVLIALNVERSKLGLSPGKKPGDIDLLILPVKGEYILYTHAMAIEVKILRSTLRNPGKNVNKFGVSQVLGLRNDGFPFVGLLHIAIPENSPEYFNLKIPFISNKLNKEGELIFTGEYGMIDPFPIVTAYRQEGRILAKKIPDDISYNVIAFKISEKGTFMGFTIGFSYSGYRNPFYSKGTTKMVKRFYENNKNSFIRINWYK